MLEINNPIKYNVALYIRISKEDDAKEESESIINQRSMLTTFAKDKMLSIYDIYIDDGYSGTNFDRPSFIRMIKDIEDKKVNMVITKDLSRLGRDYIQTGHYLEKYFPETGVRYLSVLDGIDTGIDSSVNDITPFKAIINDMYAKDISKKIRSVKKDKVSKGLYIGGHAPYGYTKPKDNKNKLIVDEESANVVKFIYNKYLEEQSINSVALILTQKGILTPSGYKHINCSVRGATYHAWKSKTVKDILMSQVYIGDMVQNKYKKINYKSKKVIRVPKNEWVIVKGTHEPIINKDIFDRVQLLIKKSSYTRERKHNREYTLNGLIFCHECGRKLELNTRIRATQERNLRCPTYGRYPKLKICESHYVKESLVTQEVFNSIKQLCQNYVKKQLLFDIANDIKIVDTIKQDLENEILLLNKKLEYLNNTIDNLYMDKISGVITETDFIRISKIMMTDRKNSLIRLGEIEEIKNNDHDNKKEININRIIDDFLKMEAPSREILCQLIDRIELTKEKKIIINYSFKELEKISLA